MVENNWKQIQIAKKEDRKVLGWSSGEDDDSYIVKKPKNKSKNPENFECVSPSEVHLQVANSSQIISKVSSIKNPAQMLFKLANQIKIENELEQDS